MQVMWEQWSYLQTFKNFNQTVIAHKSSTTLSNSSKRSCIVVVYYSPRTGHIIAFSNRGFQIRRREAKAFDILSGRIA